MFLKPYRKSRTLTGDQRLYFKLCESYRTADSVRHQVILDLGMLEALPDVEDKKKLGIRISELVQESRTGMGKLFPPETDVIEKLANAFFDEIKLKKRLDVSANNKIQAIDTESIENKDVVEVGAEWLCSQALDQLGIGSFLQQKKWSDELIRLAYTHIISRAVYPASEFKTAKWIKQNSGICEITNYPIQKITKDKLYTISHRLYEQKDDLEKYLSTKTNELFDLEDKILLYDLTNTYFEGAMRESNIAKFGRSKEKRNDARLIVLALVVNTQGFPKYSHIFEGNMSDSKSLGEIIETLSERTSATTRKPTVVMDAGIATEENLKLIISHGYEYICVSRKAQKHYEIDQNAPEEVLINNNKKLLTVQSVKQKIGTDHVVKVYSSAKEKKEKSMDESFSKKFELGLQNIKDALSKKSGVKQKEKVHERIGRLKQKYPSIHKHYNIDVAYKGNIVIDLNWAIIQHPNTHGIYFIRTSLNKKDNATLWQIYNSIREIESTFRCLKTDIDLRPIYHKTDAASMAHIHLALLAYWTVNAIRHQLKANNINTQWCDIVRTMNTQKLVTTTMQNQYKQTIVIRQCSEPIKEVQHIYQALNYKSRPFARKKSVVTPANSLSEVAPNNQSSLSG